MKTMTKNEKKMLDEALELYYSVAGEYTHKKFLHQSQEQKIKGETTLNTASGPDFNDKMQRFYKKIDEHIMPENFRIFCAQIFCEN